MKTLKKPLVVYKGAYAKVEGKTAAVIVVLELPKGAKVTYDPNTQGPSKNRANKAKVLSIESVDGFTRCESATSRYDAKFKYKVGKMATPHWFSPSTDSCSAGIHFFLRRREAHDWVHRNVDDPQNVSVANEALQRQVNDLNARLATANARLVNVANWAKQA